MHLFAEKNRQRYARFLTLLCFICISFGSLPSSLASSENVGIGAAVGAAYSPTHVFQNNIFKPVGSSFSWGFFVDIPLTETFYISPAAMLYKLNLGTASPVGQGSKPVTDIDLNFKFILPLGIVHLGPGLITGLTSAEETYHLHLGALVYVGVNLVSNMDAFVLAQYKRIFRHLQDLDDLHGYAGLMFRF